MPDSNQSVIIIGAGFAGLGMAIRLQQAGFSDITILEKANDVGGVWRDNSYPGAACDVPSHLYSFSFEPNPRWSHAFAPQPEIQAYLQHCADKYDVRRLIRFGVEVATAAYDEASNRWQVELKGGEPLTCRYLITATGQLSRPLLPNIPGMDCFKGRRFHSATWDHDFDLNGKTVAVIGTGASAVQFVPEVAKRVNKLHLFQRTPNYFLPRKDRPYTQLELNLMQRFPVLTKLYRLWIFLNFESRSIGFSKWTWMMTPMVKWPFLRMLKQQVADPTLREQLTPDFPIGCKRILLSSEYLETMTRPNVDLVTEAIARIHPDGVETQSGQRFPVDAIIFGTGFAATEFLAPMTIIGRNGVDLNTVWQRGAEAYLGITVPDFPNFFMLYGPNTNLGHNSIVYMLESQIAHVQRCLEFMRAQQVHHLDLDVDHFRDFNRSVQQRLKQSVWNGCKSWYIDESGHNSVNWAGNTLRYRWYTKHRPLVGYRFDRNGPLTSGPLLVEPGKLEAFSAALLRGFMRIAFKPLIGPPFGVRFQRWWSNLLAATMPASSAALRYQFEAGHLQGEIVAPKATGSSGAILFLHGGAYCLGSPYSHRSLTTHLAATATMDVWVPDYPLAPEHPYPAALVYALDSYRLLLKKGYRPADIVIAGDSAGGGLALALALKLKQAGMTQPAGLMLLSPFVDGTLSGDTLQSRLKQEPMLREGWLRESIRHYEGGFPGTSLLQQDMKGLAPMLIQVGADEILLSDATRLAEHARAAGVTVTLETYRDRWHVFQLTASQLRSARKAIKALGDFAKQQTGNRVSYINPRSAMDTTSPSPTTK